MKLGNKIVSISQVSEDDFSLNVEFSDGFRGRLTLKKFFAVPRGLASEVLKGGMFQKCFLESGALAWPNGLELCPDTVREMLESQEKERAS